MKPKSILKKGDNDYIDENSKYFELSLARGKPIAIVEGGTNDGKFIRIVHTDNPGGATRVDLKSEGSKLMPLCPEQMGGNPNRITFAGSSLCGKSYIAGKLAEDYLAQKRNRHNRVVIISNIDHDDAYDDLPNVLRIPMNTELITEPIKVEDLKDTFTIFDDYQSNHDKKVVEVVERLRDACFNSGRHYNITVATISQVLLDGKKSRDALLNAFQLVVFPTSGGKYQMNNFLKKYMSLPDDKIEAINNTTSRWVVINRVRPLYVLDENGCYLL